MMSVSRDVILDLVPLYLAGEASPASRALVEAHLAEDPELAARVRAMAVEGAAPADTPALPAEHELRSLRRTRARLRWQRWLFALGTTCVALLFSFRIRFEGGRPVHFNFLFTEAPWVMWNIAVVGAVAWFAYFRLGRGNRSR
jgi:anti-sigma factor RsiW